MHSYVCSPEPMTAFFVPDLSAAPRMVGATVAATAAAPAVLMNVRREVLSASGRAARGRFVSGADMRETLASGGNTTIRRRSGAIVRRGRGAAKAQAWWGERWREGENERRGVAEQFGVLST